MNCDLLCVRWAFKHKSQGLLCYAQCDSVRVQGSTLYTHTATQRETHSISGYGPDPACVCTIQNNVEASSAAAIRAVPSAAPEEKKAWARCNVVTEYTAVIITP